MPNRIIRDGWIESEKIEQLDAFAERFFLRLCLRADDFGRYHANPILLKSNLFPLSEAVRSTDIPRWLAACELAGLVRCYEANGKRFVEIPRFDQRTRAKVSKFPPPSDGSAANGSPLPVSCPSGAGPVAGTVDPDDGRMPDICRANDRHAPDARAADDGLMRTETETETESQSRVSLPLTLERATNAGVTAELIYAEYPRKVDRKDALRAIQTAMKRKQPEYLLAQTKAYALAMAGKEMRFVPQPARWFNAERYDLSVAEWNPDAVRVATPRAQPRLQPEPADWVVRLLAIAEPDAPILERIRGKQWAALSTGDRDSIIAALRAAKP